MLPKTSPHTEWLLFLPHWYEITVNDKLFVAGHTGNEIMNGDSFDDDVTAEARNYATSVINSALMGKLVIATDCNSFCILLSHIIRSLFWWSCGIRCLFSRVMLEHHERLVHPQTILPCMRTSVQEGVIPSFHMFLHERCPQLHGGAVRFDHPLFAPVMT